MLKKITKNFKTKHAANKMKPTLTNQKNKKKTYKIIKFRLVLIKKINTFFIKNTKL